MKRTLALFALACLAIPGAGWSATGAAGIGDQRLIGDPACNAANFPAWSAGPALLLQEFVPDAAATSQVEACIEAGALPVKLVLTIRKGSVESASDVLAAATLTVAGGSFEMAEFFLPDVLVTEPGDRYLLQVNGDRPFRWRATTPMPDLYPRGISNRLDRADFGFRTVPGEAPNPPIGLADQAMTNDPSCDRTNFPGYASTIEPLAQEFVPAANGLDAVDLCIFAPSAGIRVSVNVRAGTAVAPGVILGRGSAVTPRAGLQWLRVGIPGVLPTVPGARYVIELPESGSFQWRDTCQGVSATCSSPASPDRYPAGSAADGRDYGFRTIGGTVLSRRVAMLAAD